MKKLLLILICLPMIAFSQTSWTPCDSSFSININSQDSIEVVYSVLGPNLNMNSNFSWVYFNMLGQCIGGSNSVASHIDTLNALNINNIGDSTAIMCIITDSLSSCIVTDTLVYDSLLGWSLLSAHLSTDNPCQISTNDTTVCKSEEVIVTSNSNLDYLWPDGSTTNSFSIYAFNDTTIQLIFTDNGNIICSDSIDIDVNIPIIPTITQIGTSLSSSQANYYQWYMDGVILNGENSQILQNVTNGVYSVVTKDINGCMSESTLYTIFNTASWDCLNNDCVDLGNGTGIYSTLSECQLNCMSSQIQENSTTKKLLKVTDLLGREIDNPKQPSIYFYNDGSVEKKVIIE